MDWICCIPVTKLQYCNKILLPMRFVKYIMRFFCGYLMKGRYTLLRELYALRERKKLR